MSRLVVVILMSWLTVLQGGSRALAASIAPVDRSGQAPIDDSDMPPLVEKDEAESSKSERVDDLLQFVPHVSFVATVHSHQADEVEEHFHATSRQILAALHRLLI
jgi:hypothetical protein